MNDEQPPSTRKEAAIKIILGELTDLFKKAEVLNETISAADRSARETVKQLKVVVKALPDKPLATIEPKHKNALIAALVAAVVGGLVAGAVVVGGVALLSRDREDARIGRAVVAAFPSLDAATREKVQAAINKSTQ